MSLVGLLSCLRDYQAGATVSPEKAAVAPPATVFQDFDANRALATAEYLAKTIGPRPAGSLGERRAASYLRRRLRGLGYETRLQQDIPLSGGGGVTCNVIGLRRHPHQSHRVLIGAHYDTKCRPGCAGANDNASGVAVTLELARVLAKADLPFSLEIAFFGGEEQYGRRSLVGSGAYVSRVRGRKDLPLAMICVDMVGRGQHLSASYAGRGGAALAETLGKSAHSLGLPLSTQYGSSGSDHVSFGVVGVPAVWLSRGPDSANHTRRDQANRLQPEALEETGRLLVHLLQHLRPR